MVLRDHYFKLALELPAERLDAAIALIKDLSQENAKDEWDYALNRLVKGLNTTRQSARYGFSIALTELVRELVMKKDYELLVLQFMEIVDRTIETKSSMKGKDERAALFGRLFGYQSLLNSKMLFDAQYTTEKDLYTYTDALLTLANSKSWLRETAIFTLCSFIQQCDLTPELAAHILEKAQNLQLTFSSEGVALYLSIPSELRPELASGWKNSDPLSRGNLPTLAKALKDVEVVDNDNKQKGSWSPRVHFVWDLLLSKLIEPETQVSHKKRKLSKSKSAKVSESISLKEFWKVVVDEMLFAEKSSHERKYWGFELFIKACQLVKYDQIEDIITSNFLRCLINQSAQQSRLLNKISVKTLNTLKQEASKNPLKAPVILACLIDPKHGGSWNFDLITKSKTTELCLGCLNGKESDPKNVIVLEKLRDVLLHQFEQTLDSGKEELKKPNDNIQKWCLDLLLQLIRGNKAFIGPWIEDILKLLIRHAFFKNEKSVSLNVRKLCQDRLNSILGDIINTQRKDSSWALYYIKYIQTLEKSHELIQDFDEELALVKQECVELLNAVEELKTKQAAEKVYSFELLFSMVLLQIYMGDEDSFSVVNELKVCFEQTFTSNSDEDSDSAVVLTEVILSFLSKKSSLLRKFCYLIWENRLCQEDDNGEVRVNVECLELLYNILTAKENKEGQRSLFDEEGEFGDASEHESESEQSEDDSDSDSDSSSDDSKGEESEKDADVDKETNIKLAAALGIPTSNSGEVKFEDLSSDDDDSSFEEESADDDEMLAMDDQLSKIFKERRNILDSTETGNKRKSEVAEAREQMIFFKHRILDLLEIFAKAQPNSELNLTMIKPLLILINLTLDKNVGTKAHKLLKKLSKTKLAPGSDSSQLKELLEWIHDQATGAKSNSAHSLACNSAAMLVAKNLVTLDENSVDEVIDIYANSMKKWAKSSSSKVQPSLFFDFINWLNSRKQK